jgi:hypothetical protein
MRRLLLPLFSAIVFLSPLPTVRAADDEARAIIDKAIKAHGGEEVLSKYKAGQFKNKGKLSLGGAEVEFTQNVSFMLPDKFKEALEMKIGGQDVNIVTLANGDKLSIEANGQKIELTDAIKESLKDAQQMMKAMRLVGLVKGKGVELAPLGEAKVEGKTTLGVRVTAKGQKDVSLFFDKETGLLAKIERRTVDPMTGNEVTEERIILEYQKKDKEGQSVPKKALVKHDGKNFIEAEVVDGKYLESLDDSEFQK